MKNPNEMSNDQLVKWIRKTMDSANKAVYKENLMRDSRRVTDLEFRFIDLMEVFMERELNLRIIQVGIYQYSNNEIMAGDMFGDCLA